MVVSVALLSRNEVAPSDTEANHFVYFITINTLDLLWYCVCEYLLP